MPRKDSWLKKQRDFKKKENKRARLTKKLKRRRSNAVRLLQESNPEMSRLEVNCKTKKRFATRQEALLIKPKGVSIYECEVCLGYHFTGFPREGSSR